MNQYISLTFAKIMLILIWTYGHMEIQKGDMRMKTFCRSFKRVDEAEKAISEVESEAKKEGLSIKDIKVIDRIATSTGGIITAGMLIFLTEKQ